MAVKSIIDIDVNDGAFKEFLKNFNKYQEALKKTPGDWSKVGGAVKEIKTGFEAGVAALVAQNEMQKLISEEAHRVTVESSATAVSWKGLARSSKDFAGNIFSATRSLLRWAEIGTAVTGLLGVGSLFGLERLAGGVAAGRYSSTGLGLGYGQQRAFNTNFSRVVNPSGFLSGVSNALGDVNARTGLYGAGLTNAEMSGSTADVGVTLLGHLKQIADNTDPRMMANVIQARQLGEFVSVEDMRRLRAMSPADFASMTGAYRTDVGAMGLSGADQNAWTNFTVQMDRAGQEIENVFAKGLVKLEPGLEKLSKSVVEVIEAFSNSATVKSMMDDIGSGLDAFAKYIGTPEFKTTVKNFADDVVALGRSIGNALQFLGIIPSRASAQDSVTAFAHVGNNARILARPRHGASWVAPEGGIPGPWRGDSVGGSSVAERIAYIRERAIAHGIDPETAVAVARSEGLGGQVGDYGTSFGDFQLHYGGSGIPGMNAKGLGDKYTQQTRLDARDASDWKQQDDWALGWAAEHGWTDWHGAAKAGIGAQQGINVTLTNESGAAVAVSANSATQ